MTGSETIGIEVAAVDGVAEHIVHTDMMLLPAFDPVITPKDENGDDLQVTDSQTFKNSPCKFHNGGLWPLVTGFYAATRAKRGKVPQATSDANSRPRETAVDGCVSTTAAVASFLLSCSGCDNQTCPLTIVGAPLDACSQQRDRR